jgi:hypothetical protein
MADGDAVSPLAPLDVFPERVTNVFEEKAGENLARRGPMRFEEGLATDSDVPNDFVRGMMDGYETGARPNQNKNVFEQWPEETMKARAHVGSAAWVEAPTYLGEFAGGSSSEAERRFIEVDRSGGRYERRNAAQVQD